MALSTKPSFNYVDKLFLSVEKVFTRVSQEASTGAWLLGVFNRFNEINNVYMKSMKLLELQLTPPAQKQSELLPIDAIVDGIKAYLENFRIMAAGLAEQLSEFSARDRQFSTQLRELQATYNTAKQRMLDARKAVLVAQRKCEAAYDKYQKAYTARDILFSKRAKPDEATSAKLNQKTQALYDSYIKVDAQYQDSVTAASERENEMDSVTESSLRSLEHVDWNFSQGLREYSMRMIGTVSTFSSSNSAAFGPVFEACCALDPKKVIDDFLELNASTDPATNEVTRYIPCNVLPEVKAKMQSQTAAPGSSAVSHSYSSVALDKKISKESLQAAFIQMPQEEFGNRLAELRGSSSALGGGVEGEPQAERGDGGEGREPGDEGDDEGGSREALATASTAAIKADGMDEPNGPLGPNGLGCDAQASLPYMAADPLNPPNPLGPQDPLNPSAPPDPSLSALSTLSTPPATTINPLARAMAGHLAVEQPDAQPYGQERGETGEGRADNGVGVDGRVDSHADDDLGRQLQQESFGGPGYAPGGEQGICIDYGV